MTEYEVSRGCQYSETCTQFGKCVEAAMIDDAVKEAKRRKLGRDSLDWQGYTCQSYEAIGAKDRALDELK